MASMSPVHQCSAACSSASIHEVELLRQQLILKDALLREIREARDAKDAVIASKDALIASKDAVIESKAVVIAELREKVISIARIDQLKHIPKLGKLVISSDAAEVCEQQLTTACSTSSMCGGSSSADQQVPLQKRARPTVPLVQALEKDEVLDEIFTFLGRKEWLFVGGVCRRWRGRYLSMCYKARTSKYEAVYQTSHRSSFVTAARFSMALDNGLQMPDDTDAAAEFFYDLPLLSEQPIEVLTLARVHGAAWHEYLCTDAAYYGNLELLKWLHKSECPWDALLVANNAIRDKHGQHELILPWVLSTVEEWSQEDKDTLLFEAGVQNDVMSLRLLLQQEAQWPKSFLGEHVFNGLTKRTCWDCEAVAWALNKGYSWGVWRCQDLAPELYTDEDEDKYRAVKLFKWAHEHDCPCTCEARAADE
eukprot:3269-Heterococcus_DN1.PRE.3